MLLDIGRIVVYCGFFAAYSWVVLRAINLQQKWYLARLNGRTFVLRLATNTLDWIFVVVTLWLLAGYWRTSLLLTAVAFGWAATVLGWLLQALSGGRPKKSNVLMASLTMRPAIHVTINLLSIAVTVVMLVSSAWIVFTRESGARATSLLAVTLGFLFVALMLQQWRTAHLLASPFLDDESRQGELNASLSRMVTLVFVLAVLLPTIGFGVSDGDLVPDVGTSVAVVAILFGVMVFGALLPYVVGVANARSLLTSYRDELSSLMRSAAQDLELPTAGWGPRLEATAASVEASYRQLAESHPLLSLDEEPVIDSAPEVEPPADTSLSTETEHGILEPLPEALPDSYNDYVATNTASDLAARLASASPMNRGLEAAYEDLIQESKDTDPRFAYLRHLREFWDNLTAAYRDIDTQPDVARQAEVADRWATYLRRRIDDLPPAPQTARPAALSVILGVSSIVVSTILSQLGERVWTVFAGPG